MLDRLAHYHPVFDGHWSQLIADAEGPSGLRKTTFGYKFLEARVSRRRNHAAAQNHQDDFGGADRCSD